MYLFHFYIILGYFINISLPHQVEADLKFDNQVPSRFHHGGVCDCLCSWFGEHDSVCDHLDGGCDASSSASELLNHVASLPQIALFVIDIPSFFIFVFFVLIVLVSFTAEKIASLISLM